MADAPRTARPPVAPATDQRMSLLDADPAFALAIPAAEREHARRQLAFPVQRHSAWDPQRLMPDAAMGALVLRGFLLGSVGIGNRRAAFVIGPGDLLSPHALMPPVSTLPATGRFDVLAPLAVLLLDDRVWRASGRWPALGRALHERLHEAIGGQRLLSAFNAFPRVDERLLGLFWYLADRWGTVGTDGIHVRLPLTHRALGELVASRRPTVTLALGALGARGLLRRVDDGWLLDPQLMEALQSLAGEPARSGLRDDAGSIFDRADAIVHAAEDGGARA